jgi:hypothetical protein
MLFLVIISGVWKAYQEELFTKNWIRSTIELDFSLSLFLPQYRKTTELRRIYRRLLLIMEIS